MDEEQVLSMEEPKKKLRSLHNFIPRAPDGLLWTFGRYLADCLGSELTPTGFLLNCELALMDLETGTNGYTGEPIRNNLVGYSPAIYNLIRMNFPRVADAVLPAEFATSVKELIKQVNADIKAK